MWLLSKFGAPVVAVIDPRCIRTTSSENHGAKAC